MTSACLLHIAALTAMLRCARSVSCRDRGVLLCLGAATGMQRPDQSNVLNMCSLPCLRLMCIVCRYPPTLSGSVRLEQLSGGNAYCLTSVTGQIFAVQYPNTASAIAAPAPGPAVRNLPDPEALH